MFEANYQDLAPEHPEWGQVAILPWDAEIFGFPVGDYRAGQVDATSQATEAFRQNLCDWADQHRVELVHCSVPATDQRWYTLLPELGFVFVDYTLKIYTKSLHKAVIQPPKIPVRSALPDDQPSVERIAQTAFRAGRYYSDPRFPKNLVDLRYKQWVDNAFATLGPNGRLYVTGDVGNVSSFFHVTLTGEEAYITIIAVDTGYHGSLVGIDLCAGVLRDLQKDGIKRMSSKVSAINSGVMNFVNFYGWRFGDPTVVFHWHAQNAPHLISRKELYL